MSFLDDGAYFFAAADAVAALCARRLSDTEACATLRRYRRARDLFCDAYETEAAYVPSGEVSVEVGGVIAD